MMEHLEDDFALLWLEPTNDIAEVRAAYAHLAKLLKKSGEHERFNDVRDAYTRIQKFLMQEASKQQEAQGIEKSFNEIQLGNTPPDNNELENVLNQQQTQSFEDPTANQDPLDIGGGQDPDPIQFSQQQQLDDIQQAMKERHGIELEDVEYLLENEEETQQRHAEPLQDSETLADEFVTRMRRIYESPYARFDVDEWRALMRDATDRKLNPDQKKAIAEAIRRYLRTRPFFERMLLDELKDNLFAKEQYANWNAFVDAFFEAGINPLNDAFIRRYHKKDQWQLPPDASLALTVGDDFREVEIDTALCALMELQYIHLREGQPDHSVFKALDDACLWKRMPFVALQWVVTWQALGEPLQAIQILDRMLEHANALVADAAEQILQLNALEGEYPGEEYLECEEEFSLLVATYARAKREVEHFGHEEPGFYEHLDRQFVNVEDNRRYSDALGKLNDFLLDALRKQREQAEEVARQAEEQAAQKASEIEAAQQAVEDAKAEALAASDSATSTMQLQLQLTTGLLGRDVNQVAQAIHQTLDEDEVADTALRARLIQTIANTLAPHFFNAGLPWDAQLSILTTVLMYADANTFNECSDEFLEAAAFAAQITSSPLFDELLQQRIDRQHPVDTARLRQKMIFFQGNYADASTFELGDAPPVEMAFYTALGAALSGNMEKAIATLEGIDAAAFMPTFANFELLLGLVTGYAALMPQLADFQPAIEQALNRSE